MMDSEYILYRKGGIDGKLRGYKHKEQKHTFTTCSPMFAKGVIKGAELTQRLQRHYCIGRSDRSRAEVCIRIIQAEVSGISLTQQVGILIVGQRASSSRPTSPKPWTSRYQQREESQENALHL